MREPRTRRDALRTGGLVGFTLVVAGCAAPAGRELNRSTAVADGVSYDYDALQLRVLNETVRLGDELRVEVTNATKDAVDLGCKIPWALDRLADGTWLRVARCSTGEYCRTMKLPAESSEMRIPLREPALRDRDVAVLRELTPGDYRFVLDGSEPKAAVRFPVGPDA